MLSEKVIQIRKDYYKKWRDSNKDKIKKYQENYWIKKAENNKNEN